MLFFEVTDSSFLKWPHEIWGQIVTETGAMTTREKAMNSEERKI